MTDNDIIKALECCVSDECTCSKCSYEDTKHIINDEFEVMPNGKTYDDWSCDEWLKKDALDLINRQKAEIERLEKAIQVQEIMLNNQDYAIKKAKDKAITEFAEIVKERGFYWDLTSRKYFPCIDLTQEYIDQIAKEMKEGVNNA